MINKIKKIDYRHYICVAVALLCLVCTIFSFPYSFARFFEGIKDLINSGVYFFCQIFGIESGVTATVNDLPKVPFVASFPDTVELFKVRWLDYWQLWATKENAFVYFSFLVRLLFIIAGAVLFLVPFILILYISFRRSLRKKNNNYNADTKPLKLFKRIAKYTYFPCRDWLKGFVNFVLGHKIYLIIWAVIWLFNFNILTIVLELAAYLLYFIVSFDVAHIYRQIYKLFLDLSVMFKFIPLWVWAGIGLIIFDKIRKKIAYVRLNHYERRNRGFINARPVVCMVCGTVNKKKTTTITDMALSQSVMFRDKAHEKMLENDLKFPSFPWIEFERDIKNAMHNKVIYNLASCKVFVERKKKQFHSNNKKRYDRNLYNYDYKKYSFFYDDKLKVVNIFDILEIYCKLYFIYILQSSLLISNYSIREDNILSHSGNFPLWDTDFFKRDSRSIDSFSRHAHILDYDMLRLGRKVVEDNAHKDIFEFGVVVITEIGKERQNNLELKELKKNVSTTNQKNDMFNTWLKMIRHSATVDNFPFVRVITDEQRPSSWGADARDLCEIVHIKESSDTFLAMPFFDLGELLYNWLANKFEGAYYKYRFNRGDNTLFMRVVKGLFEKIYNCYKRIYNQFSYCQLRVQIESGTMDGKLTENKYYIMSKKIYSKRFSTDCFSEYFVEKALRSEYGLNDLKEYSTEKATFAELKEQNSYFINDLVNMGKTDY